MIVSLKLVEGGGALFRQAQHDKEDFELIYEEQTKTF
jgi:hypothetical protein